MFTFKQQLAGADFIFQQNTGIVNGHPEVNVCLVVFDISLL